MALLEKFTKDDLTMGIWKIDETEDELLALLPDPAVYFEQLNTFTSEKRKVEYLAIRVLLFQLFGKQLIIGYNRHGKPEVLNNKINVSISHTHGYAAVIAHPNQLVGIDIERINGRVLRLQHKFMNSTEFDSIDKDNELDYSLLVWSAKETLFKIMGEEGVDFKEHLHLNPFKVYPEGTIDAYESRTKTQIKYVIKYRIYSNYVITHTENPLFKPVLKNNI